MTAIPDDEVVQVRRRWEALGLPGIIDVHTHFMPQRVLDKVWTYFDTAGPGVEWPITYREDEERRVERLRELGVRHFTSMLYPHKPDMAQWLNSWAAEFAARTPDCLHTMTLYPEASASSYVPQAITAGARIAKVHVQVGDFDPRGPLLDPAWGALQDAELPVVIHCGSGPRPGRFTGPGPIREVLERFPRLVLLIAHMGMPEYAEFLELADRFDRVHLDTTMAFTDFVEEMHPFPPALLSRLGAQGDRIVFGSDFPNIPYPYLHAVEAVERLGLGDVWVRGVLHDNAARLLGLG